MPKRPKGEKRPADVIAADIEAPPEGTGYVRAETAEEAVALVGHPEANVYPLPADSEWPGEPDENVSRWP